MKCRHCKSSLHKPFLDLGFAPPSNAYLEIDDLQSQEKYFPLKVMVCEACWLVQTLDYTNAEDLFQNDYAYFSSTSSSFLDHAAKYCKEMIKKLELSKDSYVIEVASNDGYLLKNFVKKNIPCLGIEPTDSTANAAEKIGIPVLREFFGEDIANQIIFNNQKADLIIGNNVFAHVPDINDFTKGLAVALKQSGTITLEFPHLMQLLEAKQFDTIYHEHFSYLSLHAVNNIFKAANLRVYDVEELVTHGGSIRVFGCHSDSNIRESSSVQRLLDKESSKGMITMNPYSTFQESAEKIKDTFLQFLIDASKSNKTVAGYGAAAKGNTLINFAGVKTGIQYVADAAEAKQNKFLPGSHIPICTPEKMILEPVDYIIIFPWNIADEIKNDLRQRIHYKTQFVTFIPELLIENI